MNGINRIGVSVLSKWDCETCINGCWVLARPVGMTGIWYRIKCAWEVFTGRADVLKWYKQ